MTIKLFCMFFFSVNAQYVRNTMGLYRDRFAILLNRLRFGKKIVAIHFSETKSTLILRKGEHLSEIENSSCFCFLFNVPVNNFSVILGRNHRFLGIYQCFGKLKESYSRTLHGERGVRTLDLSLRSPTVPTTEPPRLRNSSCDLYL